MSPRTPSRPPAHSPDWVTRLTAWFLAKQRPMPWREQPTPYRVWISEIMLQQTQVATVIPYFERFLASFPDVAALAAADLQDVLKLWEGLGYYGRARNLHRAARQVMERHGGRLPDDPSLLRRLPGFGDYTTAAVASLAFGKPLPVVDGNVLRVFARFWVMEQDIALPRTRRDLSARLEPFIAQADPSVFNQAVMELGALVCRPTSPACGDCPLAPDCRAFAANQVERFPRKTKRPPTPTVEIAVGLIRRGGKVLVGKRPENKMLGGLWELPGGKLLPGETPLAALAREVREETGLDVRVGAPIAVISHTYSHFKLRMHAFFCTAPRGRARPLSSDELRWVAWDDLRTLPFPKATLKLFDHLDAMRA